MAASLKFFGNAPVLAVANGIIKTMANLQKGRRDPDFDEVLAGGIKFIKKARGGYVCRRTQLSPGDPRLEFLETYHLMAPALKTASIPGSIEREQLDWLINILAAVKHGMPLPEKECAKITLAFQSVAREAIG